MRKSPLSDQFVMAAESISPPDAPTASLNLEVHYDA